MNERIEYLISLPPEMAARFSALEGKRDWHAAADPAGRNLGSGGGTAHLLVSAWRATGHGRSFHEWLAASGQDAPVADGADGTALEPMESVRQGMVRAAVRGAGRSDRLGAMPRPA